ncbi:MAG: thioredoxin domain-containing protein [Anaerolineae bacterium]|nr:thioredoxin domain-containing protein [Anaerolineae bacterium]
MAQLLDQYAGEVRFVYRHFPLSSHDKSLITAQAAEAAGLQGKYYEMVAAIFKTQDVWGMYTQADFETWAVEKAVELGLDDKQFQKDLNSDAIVKKVKAAQDFAVSLGIPGTPFLVINGSVYQGARDPQSMYEFGKFTMKKYSDCPPMAIDADKEYTATLETAKGDIVIKLFPDVAPVTVNSFVFLARQGWFDGMTFHRVIPGFVAQTGDPSGTGTGGPGYRFGLEIVPELVYDRTGLVGMARSNDPGSNGSQFFITFAPVPSLNGQYTIFGEVIQGMDVAEQLTARDPQQGNLPPGDVVTKVTIKEN